MTDEHKPTPHPAPQPMAKKAKPKPKASPSPKPAPRAPIPSVVFRGEAAPSKGKIAAAVGVTLAAGALIGRAVFGVAQSMMRRGQ